MSSFAASFVVGDFVTLDGKPRHLVTGVASDLNLAYVVGPGRIVMVHGTGKGPMFVIDDGEDPEPKLVCVSRLAKCLRF